MRQTHRDAIGTGEDLGAQESGIDRALAERAVAMALPLVHEAMRDPYFGDSGFLHIVVMDPDARPGQSPFEQAILHEHSVGDRSKWDADYAAFARGKARESWTRRADNPKGAVCLDGIVVGASGAFEPFDQAYAGTVAMCLRALARHRSS
ncbi:MAG TPA: hypothetical protein VLS49_08320 [Usitatibacter sp.]|nr:hypothetical protein [Usitatibacter sp.]